MRTVTLTEWLERELNFLSIGGIIVLVGPIVFPLMSFEV